MRKLLVAGIATCLSAAAMPAFAPDATATPAAGQVASAAVTPADEVLGHWQGKLRQVGVPPFVVTVNIASLQTASANTVSYTGINCTGYWQFDGRRGTTFRFVEILQGGGGPLCNSVGAVTLVPLGNDRMHFVYHGGAVTSHGILTRVGQG